MNILDILQDTTVYCVFLVTSAVITPPQ